MAESADSLSNSTYNRDKMERFFTGDWINKPVTEVPGIGKVNGEKLGKAGYKKAGDLLNKFRELDRSKSEFLEWLYSFGITNDEQTRDIFRCVKEMARRMDLKNN